MKAKYLKTHEISNIEAAIYNDDNKTLYSLLPDTLEEASQESIKELVGAVEYTVILPGRPYILTNECRVYNTRHRREVKVSYTPLSLSVTLNYKYLKLTPFFKKMGWEYDHKTFVEYAYKNDMLIVTPAYKPLFSNT